MSELIALSGEDQTAARPLPGTQLGSEKTQTSTRGPAPTNLRRTRLSVQCHRSHLTVTKLEDGDITDGRGWATGNREGTQDPLFGTSSIKTTRMTSHS